MSETFKDVPATTAKRSSAYQSLWEKYDLKRPADFGAVHTTVLDSFGSYLNTRSTKTLIVDFYVDPNLISKERLPVEIETTIKIVQLHSRLLKREFEKPISVIMFNDWNWLKQIHLDGGCTMESASWRSNQAMDYAAGWANSEIAALYLNYSGTKIDNLGFGSIGFLSAHEVFHLIQFQHTMQFGNVNMGVPIWFVEGGATLMSPLTLSALGTLQFDLSWFINSDNGIAKANDSVTTLEKMSAFNPRNYTLGPIACEFIIYLAGFEKYMNIWSEMGKGKSFRNAFLDATGVDLDDFYAMFEEIRPAIGIPAV